MVDRFAAGWRAAGLEPATEALLALAEKLTADCASVGEPDIARLRRVGFDDQGISSAVQVVASFNYVNRIAEGLGVEHEDWIDDRGRPR